MLVKHRGDVIVFPRFRNNPLSSRRHRRAEKPVGKTRQHSRVKSADPEKCRKTIDLASDGDLAAMKHPPTTFVRDLASRLRCRKCAKTARRPSATLIQLAWQPRHTRSED